MGFQETDIHSLEFNPFDKISKQWMLITAGDEEKSNTMTASWGGVGIMWGKKWPPLYPSAALHQGIRGPGRKIYSVLPAGRTPQGLNVCGSVSGKNVEDKWKEAGLHPFYVDGTTGWKRQRCSWCAGSCTLRR